MIARPPARRATRDRADRLVALLALATVTWLLAVEGRAGLRARRGAVLPRGRALLGLVRGARPPTSRTDTSARSFTPAGHRPLLERQRARSPGGHEDALRPVLARLPSLHLHGPRARVCTRSPCAGGTSRCRCSRATRPRSASRRSCSRRCWSRSSTGSRGASSPWPAAAAGAVLTLAQPHYFFHAQIACFDAPITTMAFAVGFAYWKSLRSARWGVATRRRLRRRARHEAQRLADADLPRGPLPVDAARTICWRGAAACRACRWPSSSMAALGPLIFLLHWPWLWQAPLRAHARLRQSPPRSTSTTTSSTSAGTGTTRPPTTALKLLRATGAVRRDAASPCR